MITNQRVRLSGTEDKDRVYEQQGALPAASAKPLQFRAGREHLATSEALGVTEDSRASSGGGGPDPWDRSEIVGRGSS